MKMRFALTAACLAVGSFLSSAVAQAATYDLAADFGTANSPGSAWSFAYSGGALPHQASAVNNNHLYPAIPGSGFFGTGSNLNADNPFIFKAAVNGSSANGVPGQTLDDGDFLAGDVVVHSPNDGSALTITWTAPAAGTINNLEGSVWYAHSTVDRSNDASFSLAGTVLNNWTLSPTINSDRSGPGGVTGDGVLVAAGDLLTLTFAKTALQAFGSLAGVALSFDFNATAVTPIPAALPMFITALAGLGWFARRRRGQAA